MAAHLRVRVVLFANEATIMLTDRTLFVAPAGMRLPNYPASTTLVIEYEILEGQRASEHSAGPCVAGLGLMSSAPR
jgi:hypothetical protein